MKKVLCMIMVAGMLATTSCGEQTTKADSCELIKQINSGDQIHYTDSHGTKWVCAGESIICEHKMGICKCDTIFEINQGYFTEKEVEKMRECGAFGPHTGDEYFDDDVYPRGETLLVEEYIVE